MVAMSNSRNIAVTVVGFLMATLLQVGVFAHALHAQTPACSPDADARIALERWIEKWTMAPASDSLNSGKRTMLHLPVATNTSQVNVITSSPTCQQLRSALAVSLGGNVPDTSLSVVAVQVDTVYVALDKAQKAGDYIVVGVYGSAYQELARFFH